MQANRVKSSFASYALYALICIVKEGWDNHTGHGLMNDKESNSIGIRKTKMASVLLRVEVFLEV
jgi:hypothetical protein